MQQDAGATAPNSMGKIGAVANDIADTDKEISDIEGQLKKKKDYKKHLSENVLPNLSKFSFRMGCHRLFLLSLHVLSPVADTQEPTIHE